MNRLFVAIDLPDDIRAQLAMISAGLPGVRWVPPENMHLTLRFIGDVDGATARDVADELEGIDCESFDLQLASVGTFDNGRQVRVLWAGVRNCPALNRLQRKIEGRLQAVGAQDKRRTFRPHITLARPKNLSLSAAQPFLANNAGFESRAFKVSDFVLYQSWRSASGAVYRAEAEYALGEAA